MPFSFGEFRFWNKVSDADPAAWATTQETNTERRFDAAFNHHQLSRDFVQRQVICGSKVDFKKLQMVSGTFGLVGVSQVTEQGGDNVPRFRAGIILYACASDACLEDAPETGPGKILVEDHLKLRKGGHGPFKMTFDRQNGKKTWQADGEAGVA
jgi:hypothetical protein